MLHISPRVPGQSFDELPFEEEILDFLRFLVHNAQIKTLTDVNVNKLFQPWRLFAAVINKCLTGKSSSFDSFRLSQVQILWGLYHKRNIDYTFLIWEDFVYQVENNQKKSNKMYYPRFTKVIIHHIMTKKPSISRRNKTEDIINTKAYKEYYACATGEAAPKPKGSARRKRCGFDSSTTPPTAVASPRTITTVAAAPRLTAATKGKQPAKATSPYDPLEHGGSSTDEGTGSKPRVPDIPSDDSEEEISWNSSDDEDVNAQDKGRDDDEGNKNDESDDGKDGLRVGEEQRLIEEEEADELYRNVNINQGRGLQVSQDIEDSHALVDAYEADKTILESYGQTTVLKRRREDDDDQEGPSAGSDRGSKRRREGGDPESASTLSEPATKSAGRSTTWTQSRQMSANESAFAEEPMHTTYQMDEPSHPVKPPTPDRDWNKTLPAVQGSAQTWISELAKQSDSCSSFNELLDTPIDFSNFIMNWLDVDTLTPKLLARPTYELMRGSCTSLTELEYHLEEVYKATTDQLDWVNPEGQQYPHNLLEPLPFIPNNRGCCVIPFAHFINNDLEYLRGGASSQKYTTSVTKIKAADYKHIKWIEDLVPRTMRRIIAVTDLKIVEWHNYKHLDWISVHHDDDKIYKFKEGDFKRLHLQDIKDMLLLLVQGKLSNLTIEERFAFNVSLRMFTRSIVIQRRVKDLQLGVKSYQKRLNLTKLDTYRSDLKRREADRTLNDVHNALDDRLKGIRMQYLPQTIWRKGLLEDDCMRETFGCYKGPYDSSYAAPIFTE
nr:hypothetical protein [Tanacetum cinerariifolium]